MYYRLVALLFICLIVAQTQAQTVSIPEGDLKSAIEIVKEKTSWVFNFDPEIIEGVALDRQLIINTNSKADAIKELLLAYKINYEIVDGVILLIPAKKFLTKFCGHLKDLATNDALVAAHVYIDNNFGTWTDQDGYFEFEKESWKNEKLTISYVGYKSKVITAEDFKNGCLDLNLEEDTFAFSNEVIVRDYILPSIFKGQEYNGIDVNLNSLHNEMGAIERDIYTSIQFLPGINSLDESSSNFNIRGARNSQNLIAWESTPLYGSGHFFSMISPINPFVHKDVEVYKTVYDASFDNRIGGVVNIQLPSKVDNSWHGGFGSTLTEAHADLDIPIIKNKLGLQLAGRKNNSVELDDHPTFNNYARKIFNSTTIEDDEDVVSEENESEFLFNFSDVVAKLTFVPDDNLEITSSLLYTKNEFSHDYDFIQNELQGSDTLYTTNLLWSNKLKYIWSKKHTTELKFNRSYYESLYDYSTTVNGNEGDEFFSSSHNEIIDEQIHLTHNLNTRKVNWKFGYVHDRKHLFHLISENTIYELDTESEDESSGNFHHTFLSADFTLKKWHFNAGVRGSYFADGNSFDFSPRFNVSRPISENLNINISAGIFQQYIKEIQNVSQSQLNVEHPTWYLGDEDVMNAKKLSTGLNYQKNQWLIEFEAYLHLANAVPLITSGQQSKLSIDENGTSISRGAEFLIKKRWNKFNSAISYHLSFLDIRFPSIEENFFAANNDQRHNLSWINYFHHKKWSFGANYKFHSGLPYTITNKLKLVQVQEEDYFEKEIEGFNTERLKDFHRLDLSVSYNTPFFKGSFLNVQLLLFNSLDFNSTTSRSTFLSNIDESSDEPEIINIEQAQLGRTPQLLLRVSF